MAAPRPRWQSRHFALLSLQLLTVQKLKFSQLASSVFGLFYCGEQPKPQLEDVCASEHKWLKPLRLQQENAIPSTTPTSTEMPELHLTEQ